MKNIKELSNVVESEFISGTSKSINEKQKKVLSNYITDGYYLISTEMTSCYSRNSDATITQILMLFGKHKS